MIALGVAALLVATAGADRPVDRIRGMVGYLAADERRGRGLGSPELEACGREVQAWLERAGVSPGHRDEWYQPFDGPAGEALFNVVGRVEGTGEEVVVVGAHYDGLGLGLPGTEAFGQVLNGADDNAAGVAALVEIARGVAGEDDLERSVLFVAFSGEEAGALGSGAFVEDPPVPLARTVAMLNLDTVGRIEGERLIVFGTGTANEFPDLLRGVNYGFGFDLAFRSEGAGASDHAPFFAKGVPVLHLFSGAKPEYHRPSDDVETLNLDGIAKLAEFATEIVVYLAATEVPITFRQVGVERVVAERKTERRRVSFGSIPDFSRESGGILLSGVMPGGAAEAAGLTAGDLLVELDGTALDTIYDFQGALSEHAPGDVVRVKYVRGEEAFETDVTLHERR